MTKGICIQSVRTVKTRIEPGKLGICITSKTIYGEGTPSGIYFKNVSIGNTPVVKINDLIIVISFLIKRTGNPFQWQRIIMSRSKAENIVGNSVQMRLIVSAMNATAS